VFATIHVITFTYLGIFSKLSNGYICIHHATISELRKRFCRFLFSFYRNHVFHVVSELFLSEKLIDIYHVNKELVTILPFPIQRFQVQSNQSYEIYDFVALSASGSEQYINNIIEYEKRHNCFKKAGIKVLLKSSGITYDNGYLTVISSHLDFTEYKFFIASCKAVISLNGDDFISVSGPVIEALSNSKYVIGSPTAMLCDFQRRYAPVVRTADCIDELILLICNFNELVLVSTEISQIAFNKFLFDHSEQQMAQSIERIVQLL
jgi:hypothetical protein